MDKVGFKLSCSAFVQTWIPKRLREVDINYEGVSTSHLSSTSSPTK